MVAATILDIVNGEPAQIGLRPDIVEHLSEPLDLIVGRVLGLALFVREWSNVVAGALAEIVPPHVPHGIPKGLLVGERVALLARLDNGIAERNVALRHAVNDRKVGIVRILAHGLVGANSIMDAAHVFEDVSAVSVEDILEVGSGGHGV